jgi:hypothetical protein
MQYLNPRLAWNTIKEKKVLFIGLVILQVILIAFIATTTISYQIKIVENSQGILQGLQGANYDTDQLQAGQPFLQNANVFSTYAELKRNATKLIGWLLGFFLIGNGILWVGTHAILHTTGWKENALRLWRYILLGISFIAACTTILPLLVQGAIKNAAATGTVDVPITGPLLVLGFLYYLFLIGVAFIDKPWKETFSSLYHIGIRKILKTIPILIILTAVIFVPLYLVYESIEKSSGHFTVLSVLLLVILVVATRVYWLVSMRKIE